MATITRVGSPFSYARFASAEHVCIACQEYGKREYGVTFAVTDTYPQRLAGWIPACDVCETLPRYMGGGVTVTLPPFEETPASLAF